MPVKIHKGNLFDAKMEHRVLAHGVNCAGAMGKGIAVEFKKRFTGMYEDYRLFCKEGRMVPGMAWLYEDVELVPYYDSKNRIQEREVVSTWIYNLAIKSHWRLPATCNAVEASLANMVESLQEQNLERAKLGLEFTEVSMPWIGCGLGGLKKDFVKKLMEKSVKGTEITIHVYEL